MAPYDCRLTLKLGLGHQPPSDRHHLLLATGKIPTQHIGVSSRNGKNRTLRPSKDHSTKRKRSRTRLQLVLCDDWHGNTGCLVAQDLALLTKVRSLIHEETSLLI